MKKNALYDKVLENGELECSRASTKLISLRNNEGNTLMKITQLTPRIPDNLPTILAQKRSTSLLRLLMNSDISFLTTVMRC